MNKSRVFVGVSLPNAKAKSEFQPENRAWIFPDPPARLWAGDCTYCDARATTIDHVIPGSRYWLVPACLSCNASKGKRTARQWLDALIDSAPSVDEAQDSIQSDVAYSQEWELIEVRKAALRYLRILRLRRLLRVMDQTLDWGFLRIYES